MNIKRILPMDINLVIRNLKDFIFQKEYNPYRTDEKALFYYLDAASYGNIGDQAIAFAIECFLDDTIGNKYVRVINEAELIRYIASLKKCIRVSDVIVLSGGGNMGDMYPRYEALRRLVIKSFPQNKIIIFPQTIDYSMDSYGRKELAKAKKIYGRHHNLIVCAREKTSYDELASFCERVLLVPDIVLSLYGKFNAYSYKSVKIGLCLRDDSESTLDETQKEFLLESINEIDANPVMLSTMASLAGSNICINYKMREALIKKIVLDFSKCGCIVTDRLHGMIFSILANTPCICLDNSNHKVFGVYNTIKYDFNYVNKAEDINEIKNCINYMLKLPNKYSGLKPDYTSLVSLMKGI